MIFAAGVFFVAAIAFAVVNIRDIIEVINNGGPDYEDDEVLAEASAYVEKLIRSTTYDRYTIVRLTAEKFNLDRGIVEWMIV